MKRFGIILLGILLWAGISAQSNLQNAVVDSSATINIANDSIANLYMNENLDPKEAILLQKLTPEQIMTLEKQRLEQQRYSDMPLPAWAIVLICIAPFLMVVFIVFFSAKSRKEQEKVRHDVYLKSLELGQPLPDKFFDKPKEQKSSQLQTGLVWLGVGVALAIVGVVTGNQELLFGLIPGFVGLGILIAYFIEKPKNNSDSESINE